MPLACREFHHFRVAWLSGYIQLQPGQVPPGGIRLLGDFMTTFKAHMWFAASAASALMCALPALAADLPVKAMPLPQTIYNWTGF